MSKRIFKNDYYRLDVVIAKDIIIDASEIIYCIYSNVTFYKTHRSLAHFAESFDSIEKQYNKLKVVEVDDDGWESL